MEASEYRGFCATVFYGERTQKPNKSNKRDTFLGRKKKGGEGSQFLFAPKHACELPLSTLFQPHVNA